MWETFWCCKMNELSVSRSGRMHIVAVAVYGMVSCGASGWMPRPAQVALELLLAATIVGLIPSVDRKTRGAALLLALLGVLVAYRQGQASIGPLGIISGIQLALLVGSVPARAYLQSARRALACLCMIPIAASTAPFWHLEAAVNTILCRLASIVMQTHVDIGPTYNGLRAAIVAYPILLCYASGIRPIRLVLTIFVQLLLAVLVAQALAVSLPQFGTNSSTKAILGAEQIPWASCLIATLSLLYLLSREFHRVPRGSDKVVIAVATASCASFVLGAVTLPVSQPRGKVLLYKPGYCSWSAPDYSLYGEYSAGMLGTLPTFLQSYGLECRMIESISESDLRWADVIVMTNVDHPIENGQVALRNFLEDGGMVLVIGDHTFVKEAGSVQKIYLNQPLEASSIRFQNDSADNLMPGWDTSVRQFDPGAPLCPKRINESGIMVGGALKIGIGAVPLLLGRHGFVDAGSYQEMPGSQGWLGNLTWDSGERLGDIVLGAYEAVGAGTVCAIGDTTGATNIGRTLYWQFWSRCFDGTCFQTRQQLIFYAIGAAVVAFLFLLKESSSFGIWKFISIGAFSASGCLVSPSPADLPQRTGLIDLACAPRGSFASWEREGLLSLAVTLARCQYTPVFAKSSHVPQLGRCSIIVLPHPTRVLEKSDSTRLYDWVLEGGRLVLAVSYVQSHCFETLLNTLQIEVGSTALGPCDVYYAMPNETTERALLPEAWPVKALGPNWQSVVSVDGKTVIARGRFGRGSVVVVGDGKFLSNFAMEGKWGHNAENIRLFSRLMEDAL